MRHFTEKDDIAFLQELTTNPPFSAGYGRIKQAWEELTERVSRTISRPVTSRSLKDHLHVLIRKYNQVNAVALRTSGIPGAITQKDILLKKCLRLMGASKTTTIKGISERSRSRSLAFERFVGNPGSNEQSDFEEASFTNVGSPSVTEGTSEAALMDLISEHISALHSCHEQERTANGAKLRRIEEERRQFEVERFEYERRRMELEMQSHHNKLELLKKQQQRDDDLTRAFKSLPLLLSQVTASKESVPKRRK